MAEKDISEKILEAYNDVFADIVNVLLFNGEQVINEDDLAEHSPRSAYKADGKVREIERDIAKYYLRQLIRIACIGFENQTGIAPDMPIRNIGYDGMDYRAQLNDKTGSRYPVITLVLYFGDKRWDKPKLLSECFDVPEKFKPYFNDYKINLFEIAFLSEEQVKMFKSDFGIVADYFVQSRTNKDYKPSPKVIKHVQETLHLLSVFTKDNRFENYVYDSTVKGEVTMSDVLTKLINEGNAEARAAGKAEGRAEGMIEGEIIGKIKGFIEALFEMGTDDETIMSKTISKFSLSKEIARDYVQKYRPTV